MPQSPQSLQYLRERSLSAQMVREMRVDPCQAEYPSADDAARPVLRVEAMSFFRPGTLIAALLIGPVLTRPASAHCDTTKGPVVTAARAALEAGNPDLVLHWVRPEDEVAIRSAFQHTVAVRALGSAARELADRYFFETLVLIHRRGEGAPYTGLTDSEPEPIIGATDKALDRGSPDELEQELVAAVRSGLAHRFAAARAAKAFRPGDVAAGRAFVSAYVPLTHWVEGVFAAAQGTSEHHGAVTGHDEARGVTVHQPADHPDKGAPVETHGATTTQHVPWIIAAVLAIAASIEAVFLVRRRRPRAA